MGWQSIWQRHEPGDYRTRDGQWRVTEVNPRVWQVQTRGNSGWWVFVSSAPTKKAAQAYVADLYDLE